MRLKATITRGLVLSLVLLASLAHAPMAAGETVTTNHSGTICKNYNAGEVTLIDYLSNGTRSLKTSATPVICPLTRTTRPSVNVTVFVFVTHIGWQTTTCTAFSYTSTGRLNGSVSKTLEGSGVLAVGITLPPKSDVMWEDYSVLCSIPGNGRGVVNSVDLAEY